LDQLIFLHVDMHVYVYIKKFHFLVSQDANDAHFLWDSYCSKLAKPAPVLQEANWMEDEKFRIVRKLNPEWISNSPEFCKKAVHFNIYAIRKNKSEK